MLTAAYIISFLGMIVLPIALWILHIPLVFGMNSFLQTQPLIVNTIIHQPVDRTALARQVHGGCRTRQDRDDAKFGPSHNS